MNPNVSVDLDDAETEQSRPVSAQLAVITDYLIEDAPFDALTLCGRLVKGAYEGAALIWDRVDDYLHNTPLEHRIHRSEKNAQAAGGKLPLGAWMELEKSKDARRRRAVAGLLSAVLVLVASCVASWTWTAAQTGIAILGPIALTLIGLHDKKLRWAVYAAPAPVAVAVVMGIESWRWWPIPAAVVAFLVVCEVVAWRTADPGVPRTDDEGRHGVDHSAYWNEIAGRLAQQKPPIGVTTHTGFALKLGSRPIVVDGREVGAEFDVQAQEPITPTACSDLERHLGVPMGGIRASTVRERAGVTVLSVRWQDVLDKSSLVPELAPRSLSIHRPIRVGRGQDGSTLELSLLRRHLICLGGTGAGKTTSVGWSILYAFEHMTDVKCFGIDLRRKNLIAPFKHLFGDRVAYNPKDAEALLKRFQGEIDRRVDRIADQLEDEDDDDIPDENWIPSSREGHQQYVCFIDELTSLTPYDKLRQLLVVAEETGRQAACTFVIFTPDLDSKRIKESSVFDQPQIKILMASSFYDVKELMGPGASASGYGVVADWERGPRDVGKLVISSDEHTSAEVYRADHLTIEEIKARRRARREAEATMDMFTKTASPEVEVDGNGDEIIDAEIVTEDDERRDAVLATALRLCGDREGLPAREANAEFDADSLAALRAAVTAKPVYLASEGKPVRAYPRPALIR